MMNKAIEKQERLAMIVRYRNQIRALETAMPLFHEEIAALQKEMLGAPGSSSSKENLNRMQTVLVAAAQNKTETDQLKRILARAEETFERDFSPQRRS